MSTFLHSQAGGFLGEVNRRTPLVAACRNALPGRVETLLRFPSYRASVSCGCVTGWTALYRACFPYSGDRLGAVEALLACGADPNSRTRLGKTALHGAVWFPGGAPWIPALCRAGADANAQDRRGDLSGNPQWGLVRIPSALLTIGCVFDGNGGGSS